jgi:hypothetical protein
MLFDWLVVGHVLEQNPRTRCEGPLFAEERQDAGARPLGPALIAAIDSGTLTALRDRAFIRVMIYRHASVPAQGQRRLQPANRSAGEWSERGQGAASGGPHR